jgi:hypothetical protein
MNERADDPDRVDPDADPEMKQSTATQPDQAEGADDPAETGSESSG